jgi:hypothetical protein
MVNRRKRRGAVDVDVDVDVDETRDRTMVTTDGTTDTALQTTIQELRAHTHTKDIKGGQLGQIQWGGCTKGCEAAGHLHEGQACTTIEALKNSKTIET